MSGTTVSCNSKTPGIAGSYGYGLLWTCMAMLILSGVCQQSEAIEPIPVPPATGPIHPDSVPLDVKALQPGNTPPRVVTMKTIRQDRLTIPSLWWMKDQFAEQEEFGGKLLQNWLAYPVNQGKPGRIDFVVNRQLWTLSDYLERYSFIHDFGTVARSYGYNIRVFDNQANFLAAYTCDFGALTAQNPSGEKTAPNAKQFEQFSDPDASLPCLVLLDSSGKAGFRGR